MQSSEIFRRRNLPHWDVPTAAYFVTVCLEGSIPARGLLDLQSYRTELKRRPRPRDQTPEDWAQTQWQLSFGRSDEWLDRAAAIRFLEDPRLAQIVVDALYFFAGQRYDLLGYVVMPSHLHWVFQPLEPWVSTLKPARRTRTPRERIVHSIDSYTASRCNEIMGREAAFWQREPYGSPGRRKDTTRPLPAPSNTSPGTSATGPTNLARPTLLPGSGRRSTVPTSSHDCSSSAASTRHSRRPTWRAARRQRSIRSRAYCRRASG